MNYRKRTRTEKILAVCLTLTLCAGGVAVGAYAADAPRAPANITQKQSTASSVPQKENVPAKADASTPQGTLELAMQAVKALDTDALCRYSNNQKITFNAVYFDGHSTIFGNGIGRSTGEKGPALFGGKQDLYPEIVRSLSWKIGESSVTGDTAKVTLQITNRDFGGVIAEIVSAALVESANGKNDFKEDETLTLLRSVPDSRTVALTVSAKLKKVNGNWELQIDDTLANAVCGNLLNGHETPASKAKIAAAEKIFNEYIQKSVKDAMKDIDVKYEIENAMRGVDIEKEIRDAMKDIDIQKEIIDAMKDAF